MRAAIYSRFSTDRQNESSIADQVRVCIEHADKQGWQVVERFEDQGISGAALGNRPGILKLQEAAFAGRFNAVLVTDLSRLSRSQGDLSKMIDRLVAKGVRVVGVQDGYDSSRRGHKLQAGLSGIIGEAFREMVKDRTYAALESRAKEKKPTGGRAYGYRDGKVDKGEAYIVREIFGRFADGASCRTIAEDLNARRIPSPGSSWKRSTRRASGWMGSGVRVILKNERYRGVVCWNASEWVKDPDTGRRKRLERPREEWITHVDESLRIISDDLWNRAERRVRPANSTDERLKAGGKPKYLLSGLLRCDVCDAHYTIINATSYGCSGNHDGRACENSILVRRDRVEKILLGPIRDDLLKPDRVARMAKEMQDYFTERMRTVETRAVELPHELKDLEARIARLRARMKAGDPDMPQDELQAAIDRAEEKRRELREQLGANLPSKAVSAMTKAAELYRRQVTQGLDGNPQAALKARVFLREWFGGKIRLEPMPDGGLQAHWMQNVGALCKGLGTYGSGGRI